MNLAAIDIGSNAIRLVIAHGDSVKKPEIIKKIRVPLRLGAEAFSSHKTFSQATIRLAEEVFLSFADLMRKEKVEKYLACATSAFREAKNSNVLAMVIKRSSGIDIEKISGNKEAKMLLIATLSQTDLNDKHDYLHIDLGGGSLEISQIEEGVVAGSQSFDFGTVRLMNQINSKKYNDKFISDRLKNCQNEILSFLDDKILNSKNLSIIGTGGNFRRLLKTRNNIYSNPKDYLTLNELTKVHLEMENYSYLERIKRFDLRPDRADVIIPALKIISTVLEIMPVKKIYTPSIGLVDGIFHRLTQEDY